MKLICLKVGYDLIYQKFFESQYEQNPNEHGCLKMYVF